MPGKKHAGRFSQIQSASDYVDYIQKQFAAVDQQDVIGDEINRELSVATMLGDPGLSTYLNQLPVDGKIDFLQALIVNDKDAITRVLFYPLQKQIAKREISIDAIRKVNLPTPNQAGLVSNRWLSPLTKWMIGELLKDGTGHRMDVGEVEWIVMNAMSRIPDTLIGFQAKVDLSKEISPAVQGLRVAYAEFVESRQYEASSGIVSVIDFKKVCANNNIDKGDYILLCLGLVQPLVESSRDVRDYVNDIRYYYLDSNYDAAIHLIREMAQADSLLGRKKSEAILNAGASIRPINKGKHYSRRFFENRLIAFSQAEFNDYVSVNDIARDYLPGQFNAATNMPDLIRLVSALGELSDDDLYKRMEELQARSSGWRSRGRQKKHKMYSRHEELQGKHSRSIFSHNPGVMKSSQPNYPDELTREQIRNAPTDVHTYDINALYVSTKPNSIFVTSLSSHAIFLIALLEDYIKKHQSDPELEYDVNSFVKAMVIANVSGGYHSMHEVLDAFADPAVVDIFTHNGIRVNVAWSDDVLQAAFKDSQEYTKTILLRRAATIEIEHRNSLYHAVVTNNAENVTALLSKLKSQGKRLYTIRSDHGHKVNVFETAIAHHVDNAILRQLINYDGRVNLESVMESCVRHHHLDGVRLLHELGYVFTAADLKAAVKRGHLDIVNYLIDEVGMTNQTADDQSARLFAYPKQVAPPEKFAEVMFNFKKILADISRTESRGVPYLQEKVMLMYELIDSLAKGKFPAHWHEKLSVHFSEIENLLTRDQSLPCPQLRALMPKIKMEVDEFTQAEKKRLGPV